MTTTRRTRATVMTTTRRANVLLDVPSHLKKATAAAHSPGREVPRRQLGPLVLHVSFLDSVGDASDMMNTRPTHGNANTVLIVPTRRCPLAGPRPTTSLTPRGLGRTLRPPHGAVGMHANSGEGNSNGENGLQCCSTRAQGHAGTATRGRQSKLNDVMRKYTLSARESPSVQRGIDH